jgi:histidinol dehydrogenase
MKIYFENKLTGKELKALVKRSESSAGTTMETVKELCLDVKKRGDAAVREYAKKFDGKEIFPFRIAAEECRKARGSLSAALLDSLSLAAGNIRKFHESQNLNPQKIVTTEGVTCWRESRPIETVGLYVPAGSAPLLSTVLMLGIPAKLAGCPRIILCSPPGGSGPAETLVVGTASVIGIDEVYRIGGAQAIAAMAYGTETLPKVDKIFGPGNRYVTAAKQFVSMDPDGAAIDLLAGPSEVLVIADGSARPEVVAMDLISQAEHDADAQAVLVTPDRMLAEEVCRLLPVLTGEFPRCGLIARALDKSYALITDTVGKAVEFSNLYAPEHLVINVRDASEIVPAIRNAGSVFIGPFSPVTAGDYASGTNHTLPTGGTARFSGGVSLESFRKNMTFQSLSEEGLNTLSSALITIAETEGLQAHARSVSLRLSKKRDKI